MKRMILLSIVLCVLFTVLTANAQHQIGVLGGLNFADLRISEPDDSIEKNSTDSKFGIGAILALDIGKQYFLQIQPMYLVKGGTAVPDPGDPEFGFSSSYLEVPLLLQKSFGSKIRPYVLAGPTIGFLLSSEVEVDLNGTLFTADLKDVSEKIDLGLSLGAGIIYPAGNFSLFLEGRYTLGVKDILKGGPVQFKAGDLVLDEELEPEVEVKTRGISVMAGITIPLSGR